MRTPSYVIALLLAFAALAGASSAWARPPVQAFASLPRVSDPSMSPDGTRFASVEEINGRPGVIIRPLYGNGQAVGIPSDDWIIWGVQWASNDKIVIMAGKGTKMPGGRELWTLNRAIVIGADGSNPLPLLQNVKGLASNSSGVSIVDVALNDPAHIYMQLFTLDSRGATLDVYQVDLATGDGARFMRGSRNTAGWIMDGQGHVAARIDRDDDAEQLWVPRGEDWAQVAQAGAADGGLRVQGLTTDGAGIVRVNKAGKRTALTRIDIASGQETVLLADPDYDIVGAVTDDWSGRVIGALADLGGSVGGKYFDTRRQDDLARVIRSFPGFSVQPISADVSGRRQIVGLGNVRMPLAYQYVDHDRKEVSEIGSTYPGLAAADLGEMKPYDYTARDGLHIPAFLTLPPGGAKKNLPVVVMPHGGPDAHDSLGFDWWVQFLANRGYAVLQPNYRGSTGYGEAFNAAGHGQWGLKMQDDITDGVRKLIADGIADPKRVCIVGASYGGYAALAGATLTPDLYACAVSIAGVSDLPEMIRYERRVYGRNSDAVSFWISRIGSPSDDSDKLRATSPARLAANVKCPILLMHPELDTTVPIEQSELMEEALEDEDKPVTFIKLEGDDHYLQLALTRYQMLTELEKFLAAHIGR
ncbi:MAG: S9 family peptidase [Alphaproteobacteria bacterium]|nr:S9 family peptidase [Alphaproteobacteria bacterium]